MARGKTVKVFKKKVDAEAYAREYNAAIRKYKYKVVARAKGYAVVKAPPYTIW